ncbi:Gp138 family membrane-puncturing spike protein [Clostridium sp. BJN0013]|uniref:Gp138 family membrane-puncturing spike protein n=1 Tax=Clostridium sp. BJN0013 TaxID=3236840 RepID=UPI0034C5B3B8
MEYTRNIPELIGSNDEFYRKFKENIQSTLKVCSPGIIQSFNKDEQTVTVQIALRELITQPNQTKVWSNVPLLLDVPIQLPRGSNTVLTMPIKEGDECLVIFSDRCIDSWFSYGGVQNQIEKRSHDYSDGFALVGVWSQPNVIPDYSTEATELRTIDGNTKISLKEEEININAATIKMNGIDVTPKE